MSETGLNNAAYEADTPASTPSTEPRVGYLPWFGFLFFGFLSLIHVGRCRPGRRRRRL